MLALPSFAKRNVAAAAVALALAAPAVQATPLPQAVADVIDAAADDPDSLKVVVKAAKKANPDSVAEIDAHVAALTKTVAAEKAARAADQGFFEGWTGQGEVGGSISTGNTVSEAFAGSLSFERKTPVWEHDLNLAVDYKREDKETTKERYFGAYALIRNITPRFYATGVLWGERDRFAGYDYRFSESLGLGYRLIATPKLRLRLEGGPAVRQSDYLVTGYETTFAARVAGYVNWQIAPRLQFSQSLVTYLDTSNSTLLAATALTTKLEGNLSARASYEVRHEENPPEGREKTDTTTRATLVLSF